MPGLPKRPPGIDMDPQSGEIGARVGGAPLLQKAEEFRIRTHENVDLSLSVFR